MRVLLGSTLAILILSLPVEASHNSTFDAEQLSKIPPCGMQKCLIYTIPEVGCGLVDVECHCQSNVAHRLATITAECMYANCTFSEALDLAKIQAALCEFPSESHNQFLKIMTIVCAIITHGVVLSRLAARYMLGQSLASDDYLIIAAAISDALFTAFGDRFIKHGFGEHIWNIDQAVVPQLLLFFYLCEIFYIITIALIKLSILFFYLRIFPKKSFRTGCWILIAFCTASAIAFTIVTIFQCQPIQFVWKRDPGGKCVNYNAGAFANAGVNIVQDILILLVPIPEVRHLQLTRKKKIGMYAMFGVGGLVCVFSMVRLHSLKIFGLTADPTWDNVNMTFWTTLETSTSIVCACMPAIRAVGVRHFPTLVGNRSRSTDGDTGTRAVFSLSRPTRVHSIRVGIDDWRGESQESWIGETSYVAYTPKATFPTPILKNESNDDEFEKEGRKQASIGALDALPGRDLDYDKSLPPTPHYNINMSLGSIHTGNRAAITLHSKFSTHYLRNNHNDKS